MAAKNSASPTAYRAFFHGLGHEDQFPPPSLSGRYRFGQGTFVGAPGNDEDAPIPAIWCISIAGGKPTGASLGSG